LDRATLLAVVAALYFVAGKLGLEYFAFVHASASPVWPPAGIALAAFVLFGSRVWPAIFSAALLVYLTTAGSALTALPIAVGNTLAGLMGARLTARFLGGTRAFERASDAFTFLVAVAVPSAAVSATTGVLALAASGYAPWLDSGTIWATWWLGDVASDVVLVPAVLLWYRQRGAGRIGERPLEALAVLLCVVGVAQVVFGGAVPFATKTYPLEFVFIPVLLWTAFRFGPREAATALLLLGGLAVAGTLRGVGAFAARTPNESLLLLQGFLVTMGVTILPVATLVWDRRRDEAERLELLGREQSARAEADERRRVAEQLAGTARSFTETLDVAGVGARVVDVVLASFGARASALRLLAPDGSLHGVAFGGALQDAFAPGHVLAGGHVSVSGLAVTDGVPTWSENVFTDRRLDMPDDLRRGLTASGDAAVLAVPLRVKGQIIGALSVADRAGRQFTAAEVDRLQAFADQAAVAVENARLFEEAMRQRRESEVVAALAAEINRSLDLDRVLQQVAEAATALCGGDVTHITLSEPGSDTLRLRLGVGSRIPADSDLRLGPGRGLGGRVLTTGRPLRVADARVDPAVHADHRGVVELEEIRSGMIVPIRGEDQIEGLIYVSRRRVAPFSAHDETICLRLADHAAIAIRNSRLFAAERAARAEAHAANRAKDHFLATLSHELRTPLNAVIGWLRMLRNPRLDEGQKSHAMDVIERNARLQAQLINDLLDVSRIIAGKLEMETYALDLVPVVQEAVEAIRGDVEAKALTLAVRLDPDTGEILGDPVRLQQVVANLLSNAVKFTPREGRIEVRLLREGVHARLSVADSGEGIDPQVLPHVFEPFQQADSTTTRAHQGLGLGLAIVRQLVGAHGGRVRAESAGPGQGATFVVELPIIAVREPRAGGGPPIAAASSSSRLDGLRVLIVDDHGDARELLGLVLREHGAEVHLAGSMVEALAALERSAIDVLVSDLAMPGADGFALIARVREARGAVIPAVALTAYAGGEVRERALAAGFTSYATKPVHPEDLVELIVKLPRLRRTGPADVPPGGDAGPPAVDVQRGGDDRARPR
jgi:signal transduction histidine kinase/integral membrane sensor domain MASE1/ActR/RegA family two-component response regulator